MNLTKLRGFYLGLVQQKSPLTPWANLSDTYILLKPKVKQAKGEGHTKEKLIQDIKEKLEESIPGQTLIFSQPIQLRFNELLEGVRSDVALKIYGEDLSLIHI